MLSLAVKNTILVVLIILILHFMMLNYINDRHVEVKSRAETFVEGSGAPAGVSATSMSPAPVGEDVVKCDDKAIEVKKNDSQNEEELLYNYVFTAQCPAPKEAVGGDEGSLKKSHAPSECKQRGIEGAFLINEYDEENSMSGGSLKLLDGIAAFDTLAASYQAY